MEKKYSVLSILVEKWEQEASEAICPHLHINKPRTLEEVLLQYDRRPNMSGVA
jgi:hypothetical protein